MPEKLLFARVFIVACRVGRRSLPSLLLVSVGCGGPATGPSACDGLAEKTVAITRADYTKCADEILGSFEQFETSLRRFADGDAAAKDSARSASRRLAHLMGEVGFGGDTLREVQGGAGRAVERWPDASMREFNALVVNAAAQLNSVLAYPNQDNLQQGARLHAQARSTYSRFR